MWELFKKAFEPTPLAQCAMCQASLYTSGDCWSNWADLGMRGKCFCFQCYKGQNSEYVPLNNKEW